MNLNPEGERAAMMCAFGGHLQGKEQRGGRLSAPARDFLDTVMEGNKANKGPFHLCYLPLPMDLKQFPNFDPRAAVILNEVVLTLKLDLTTGKIDFACSRPEFNEYAIVDVLQTQAQFIFRGIAARIFTENQKPLAPGAPVPPAGNNGGTAQ